MAAPLSTGTSSLLLGLGGSVVTMAARTRQARTRASREFWRRELSRHLVTCKDARLSVEELQAFFQSAVSKDDPMASEVQELPKLGTIIRYEVGELFPDAFVERQGGNDWEIVGVAIRGSEKALAPKVLSRSTLLHAR